MKYIPQSLGIEIDDFIRFCDEDPTRRRIYTDKAFEFLKILNENRKQTIEDIERRLNVLEAEIKRKP